MAILVIGVALILLAHTLGGIVVRLDAAQVIIGIAVGADVDTADLVCHFGDSGFGVCKVFDKRAGADGGGFLGQPLVGIEGVGGFCLLGTADFVGKAAYGVIRAGGCGRLFVCDGAADRGEAGTRKAGGVGGQTADIIVGEGFGADLGGKITCAGDSLLCELILFIVGKTSRLTLNAVRGHSQQGTAIILSGIQRTCTGERRRKIISVG